MSKIKIILIFVVLLTIPSYFILRSKNLNVIGSFKDYFKNEDPIMGPKMKGLGEEGKITITENELNLLVNPYSKTIDNFEVDITQENVLVKGETTIPTRAELDISIALEVENGKILYKVQRMNLGKIKAPAYLADKVIEKAGEELDKQINQKIVVEKIELYDDKIVIYGKSRGQK